MIYHYDKLIEILMKDNSWYGDASPQEAFGIDFVENPGVFAYEIQYKAPDETLIILSFNEKGEVVAMEFS